MGADALSRGALAGARPGLFAGSRAVSTRVTALACVALVACVAPPGHSGVGEGAIIDGAPAPDDEAVVALVTRRSRCGEAPTVFCSGALVARRAVVTAAHCLEHVTYASEIEVFVGADVMGDGTFVVAQAVTVHPDYDRALREHDVALIALAEDAPATPLEIGDASLDDVAPGATLTAVGFGVSAPSASDGGVRRRGAMALGEVRAASFDATPAPALSCRGDSGGPVFAEVGGREVWVGVTTSGDVACRERASHVRVDTIRADFVAPALAALGELGPAWGPSAIPLDELERRACMESADCPALLECGVNARGEARCALPGIGPASVGGACAADAECAGGVCARLWPAGPDACRCAAPSVAPPPPPPPGAGGSCTVSARGARLWWALGLALLALRRRARGAR